MCHGQEMLWPVSQLSPLLVLFPWFRTALGLAGSSECLHSSFAPPEPTSAASLISDPGVPGLLLRSQFPAQGRRERVLGGPSLLGGSQYSFLTTRADSGLRNLAPRSGLGRLRGRLMGKGGGCPQTRPRAQSTGGDQNTGH